MAATSPRRYRNFVSSISRTKLPSPALVENAITHHDQAVILDKLDTIEQLNQTVIMDKLNAVMVKLDTIERLQVMT